MQFEREARKARSVPMTPLIDVVFLLLIFFMLSTSFDRNESLELNLPGAAGEGMANEGKLLQVFVSSDDKVYVGRRPVEKNQLVPVLKKTLEQYPEIGVLLLSGPRVSVQQLISVMDNIYLAGSTNLSVASWEPEEVKQQADALMIEQITGSRASEKVPAQAGGANAGH